MKTLHFLGPNHGRVDPSSYFERTNIQKNYVLMDIFPTYALSLDALRQAYQQEKNDCHSRFALQNGIYRPLTFKENIEARVNDFETLENPDGTQRTEDERLRLFQTWLNSCCGIIYQAKTTKLKLRFICPELINIDPNFNQKFLQVSYDEYQADATLDSDEQTFVEKGWRTLLEEDGNLYEQYLGIISSKSGDPNFMVQKKVSTDELRAVCLNGLYFSSYAYGFSDLNYYCRFVRVVVAQRLREKIEK